MNNNDIFRRLRYLFNFNDSKIIEVFKLTDSIVSETEVTDWLKKDEDPEIKEMADQELAAFLNGLIIENRGKREGPLPEAEKELSNNMILKKLKTALDLKTDDILDLFELIDKKISKHELSAFFRSPDHSAYRPFMDQYLRNFLNALQTKSKKTYYENKSNTTSS